MLSNLSYNKNHKKSKILSYKKKIITALRLIIDPEILINIWDLGLIYKISYRNYHQIYIEMTLTSFFCPVAKKIISQVINEIEELTSKEVKVKLVWFPKWSKNMMSTEAKFTLELV